jgi:DUF3037 family protein
MAESFSIAPVPETALVDHILRYTPNLVRDEWINVGILLFNPATGERRLRLIEEEIEFRRVRRIHPRADESLLRALRYELEDRMEPASFIPFSSNPSVPHPNQPSKILEKVLEKRVFFMFFLFRLKRK